MGIVIETIYMTRHEISKYMHSGTRYRVDTRNLATGTANDAGLL